MAKKPTIRVATCQFPVSAEPRANGRYVRRQMRTAAAQGADVVQFPEAGLSGYGGAQVADWSRYDWSALRDETQQVRALAAGCRLWVVLGSSHYLDARRKPTNCLYLIDPRGRIVDRYDKSMLTGGDKRCYTGGDHAVTFTLRGVRCGLLICYDSCFPEMYNRYRHRGVQVMFHSFYNGASGGPRCLDECTPAAIRVRAADNGMWVVACNTSRRWSNWPTCIASPAGVLTASLRRHVPGVLVADLPSDEIGGWRHNDKRMKLPADETYRNARPSSHPRYRNRQAAP